jgi:hypothetical protein
VFVLVCVGVCVLVKDAFGVCVYVHVCDEVHVTVDVAVCVAV